MKVQRKKKTISTLKWFITQDLCIFFRDWFVGPISHRSREESGKSSSQKCAFKRRYVSGPRSVYFWQSFYLSELHCLLYPPIGSKYLSKDTWENWVLILSNLQISDVLWETPPILRQTSMTTIWPMSTESNHHLFDVLLKMGHFLCHLCVQCIAVAGEVEQQLWGFLCPKRWHFNTPRTSERLGVGLCSAGSRWRSLQELLRRGRSPVTVLAVLLWFGWWKHQGNLRVQQMYGNFGLVIQRRVIGIPYLEDHPRTCI